MLWIAFIFQYLWDTKQLQVKFLEPIQGCELLSFFSIFGIQNNYFCLIIVINGLWIAFIFQYLWDTKQPAFVNCEDEARCELLSFFSIFGIQNNLTSSIISFTIVVNCFHFSVSLGYKTTQFAFAIHIHTLWIAFIFQYLWDTKQRWWNELNYSRCCELLSFFSIFRIQNNWWSWWYCKWVVVNCFHFSVSLGYKTTKRCIVCKAK